VDRVERPVAAADLEEGDLEEGDLEEGDPEEGAELEALEVEGDPAAEEEEPVEARGPGIEISRRKLGPPRPGSEG